MSLLAPLLHGCFDLPPIIPDAGSDSGDVGPTETDSETDSETDAADDGSDSGSPPGGGGGDSGVAVFSRDGSVWRVSATEGAEPEDLSAALDALSPGTEDSFINISSAGDWLVLHTDRFDAECVGWPCLALVRGDLSEGQPVRAGGEAVHPEGSAAVGSGGDLIVYPSSGGPHAIDLFAIRRDGAAWTSPLLLTADSEHAYHGYPAISDDGARVVFDCGPTQYGQEGTNICEVGTDGGGFGELATVDAPPAGLPVAVALHHPDYAPDGSVIYEGDYDGEQIWRLPAGGGQPQRVGAPIEGSTDNSPCALPDGRVVTVAHAVPNDGGGQGQHELKVIEDDGDWMLVRGGDIVDEGIGCGGGGQTRGRMGRRSRGGEPRGRRSLIRRGEDEPRARGTIDDGGPSRGGYFPEGSVWTQRVDDVPVDPSSDEIIRWLDGAGGWGTGQMRVDTSIEVLRADDSVPLVPWTPTEDHFLPDCDLDPVPLPPGGALEYESGYACTTDGDCHLIVVHEPTRRLFEMWRANLVGERLYGGCLAVWDLGRVYGPSGRGEQCTSADAAGYPIAPLLFTADEVASGRIDHALRFVLPNDRIRAGEYVHPATHSTDAASGPPSAPPYGARLRLRADYPLHSLPSEGARVVARAMQQYGMLLADGGSITLTAQSDRSTTASWDGLLDSYDLSGLEVRDFEVLQMPDPVPLTYDCRR